VSNYCPTFRWLPPAEEAARAETWLYEGREKTGVDPWELLRAFIDRTDRVLALLDGFMPECRWLDDGATLTYLHSTISTNRHRVRVPEVPMHLDALLADQPLTGGLEPRIADEKLRLVEKIVQGRDFTVMAETVNAVDAWLGSLPGHAYANVRQPPISTLNLAHMVPLSAVWAGPERDEHFGDAPLLYARTEGSTPFRFSLHVGDVGHTLVVGPTGAGKSVL